VKLKCVCLGECYCYLLRDTGYSLEHEPCLLPWIYFLFGYNDKRWVHVLPVHDNLHLLTSHREFLDQLTFHIQLHIFSYKLPGNWWFVSATWNTVYKHISVWREYHVISWLFSSCSVSALLFPLLVCGFVISQVDNYDHQKRIPGFHCLI
jgi:hypothetical protein